MGRRMGAGVELSVSGKPEAGPYLRQLSPGEMVGSALKMQITGSLNLHDILYPCYRWEEGELGPALKRRGIRR